MGKAEGGSEEQLQVQHTLSLTIEERLELLAALIVEKIAEDQGNGELLYSRITSGDE